MASNPRKPTKQPVTPAPPPVEAGPIPVADASPLMPEEAALSPIVPEEAAAEVQESVSIAAAQAPEPAPATHEYSGAAAEEVTSVHETVYLAAARSLHEFNAKAIDAVKSNTEAAFEFFRALMNVTTISAAITVQTEHARRQFDALTAQTKELTEIATKVAAETTESLKTSVAKSLGNAA